MSSFFVKMSITDPVEQNILGVRQLVGSKTNKLNMGLSSSYEGIQGEFIDEVELDMSDEELISLSHKWTGQYAVYEPKIKKRQETNKTYYLGKQKGGTPEALDGVLASDNLIFQANETFIPAALAKNPEPVVFSDNTSEGEFISESVKTMLQYHTETLNLRANLGVMVRKWTVDLLAVMKHGWNSKIQDIEDDVRDIKNFVLDPEGYVDVSGNFVGWLGERIKCSAQDLIDLFPHEKEYIVIMVDGKLGTQVTRTEWWNDNYTFTTFIDKVLDKSKNPHFNYDKKVEGLDVYGAKIEDVEKGRNHFVVPKKPYTFLSVFSFQEEPYDVTGLIEQNIPNQIRISKRTEQIDFNLSRQNNSDVFSEDNFNQEKARQAKNALAKGNPMLCPPGRPINEAVVRLQAQGLDGSFFNDLENQKEALLSSFGVQGITANEDKQSTARGEILQNQHDSSRIGGSIGDALERVAKAVFNQHVQFYYVYYDVEHEAAIMGQMSAVQYATLSSSTMKDKKLVVSVSPDSMKPHDEITEINQAMDLFQAGVLDPKTLLTRVKFPDPQKTAEMVVLWLLDKQAYMQLNFPYLAQQLQQSGQQTMQQGSPPQGQNVGQLQAQPQQELSQPQANALLSNVPLKTVSTPQ